MDQMDHNNEWLSYCTNIRLAHTAVLGEEGESDGEEKKT